MQMIANLLKDEKKKASEFIIFSDLINQRKEIIIVCEIAKTYFQFFCRLEQNTSEQDACEC